MPLCGPGAFFSWSDSVRRLSSVAALRGTIGRDKFLSQRISVPRHDVRPAISYCLGLPSTTSHYGYHRVTVCDAAILSGNYGISLSPWIRPGDLGTITIQGIYRFITRNPLDKFHQLPNNPNPKESLEKKERKKRRKKKETSVHPCDFRPADSRSGVMERLLIVFKPENLIP